MAKYYVTRNMTGFATGVIEARKEPRISAKVSTWITLIGIIIILLIALGKFDFLCKGVLEWLNLDCIVLQHVFF